jgi:hypothetical protein
MRRVGQSRKRDSNERDIVQALEAVGVLVYRVSAPGLPDLLTWYQGRWLPLEVKHRRPRKALSDPKGRSLTPAQCAVYGASPFPIVQDVTEAFAAVGVKRGTR